MFAAVPPANADACLPLIMAMAVPLWMSLAIVIPLEAYVAVKILRVGWKKGLLLSTTANVASTVIGVPITGAILAFLDLRFNAEYLWRAWWSAVSPSDKLQKGAIMMLLSSPLIPPDHENFYWMLPVAALVMCVPFFFISVWIEYFVAVLFEKELEHKKAVLSWAWKANLISYALIVLFILTCLLSFIEMHKKQPSLFQ
ncbi:MAG TPA: hypothetical protein V6C81_14595 [Planktothrix sp.]